MTGREIARLAGLTPQRVSQLLARGESAESILSGAYRRPPPVATVPKCQGCGRSDAHIAVKGHGKRCPHRPGVTADTIGRSRCGACGVIGHNRRRCPTADALGKEPLP